MGVAGAGGGAGTVHVGALEGEPGIGGIPTAGFDEWTPQAPTTVDVLKGKSTHGRVLQLSVRIVLLRVGRTAFYAMIDAMVRGWLEPKNAEQPKDGIEKARALLLLARLAEASKSYLSSGQTVEAMFGQAAVMGL